MALVGGHFPFISTEHNGHSKNMIYKQFSVQTMIGRIVIS